MKNKKIYKIFALIFSFSLIVSLFTFNAAAFEREEGGYVDITGDQDAYTELGIYSSIYAENYALINCGSLLEIAGTVWDATSSLNFSAFRSLDRLNFFLNSSVNGVFESPNGVYTYDHVSVDYIEFFVLDANGRLQSILIHDVSSSLFFGKNGYYFEEKDPGLSYTFACDTILWDNVYFSGEACFIVAACYFNGFTPYDELNHLSDLEIEHAELELVYQGSLLELEAKDDSIALLRSEKEALESELVRRDEYVSWLESEVASRDEYVRHLEGDVVELESKIFTMKNANALDEIFSGTSNGLLILLRGIADLGYSPAPGVNVTIGGVLVVAVLGAFLVFILRLVFGGAK